MALSNPLQSYIYLTHLLYSLHISLKIIDNKICIKRVETVYKVIRLKLILQPTFRCQSSLGSNGLKRLKLLYFIILNTYNISRCIFLLRHGVF